MDRDRTEQRVLLESTLMTTLLAFVGIGMGLVSGSMAIVFDGLFSFIDVAMAVLALLVARLVVRDTDRRFQFGYWHIEPLALAFNGGMLIVLCAYAVVSAIGSILAGGQPVSLDWALGYGAFASAVSVVMWLYERSRNRRVGSQLLAIDVQSWFMTAVVSVALLAAFGVAWGLGFTQYGEFAPYVDPVVLGVLSLAVIAVPVRTVRQAISEILLIAPAELDESIRATMDEVVARHGFSGYTSYAAKVGRGRFIEIHVLVPPDRELGTVTDLDAIRAEIAGVLGPDGPSQWLTIDFTGEREWL